MVEFSSIIHPDWFDLFQIIAPLCQQEQRARLGAGQKWNKELV